MNTISSLPATGSVAATAPVVRAAPVKNNGLEGDATPPAPASSAPVAAKASATPTPAQLQQAVEQANKVLEAKTSNELRFTVDKSTGLSVVKMINQQTGETLLQFPSEAMLQIAKSIDRVTGAIIRKQA
jgi:flagellar protein FlaG